jgi:single-strand DNA-binding protein
MSHGVNKVILIGNLGKDPEVKYMPSGEPVTTFSIATSESWKDKQTGETVGRTEWHRITCFKRLAEIAGEYLKKGSKVYIEGKIQTDKWTDQNGQDRYATKIIANSLQMLDSRNSGDASPAQHQGQQAPNQSASYPNQGGYVPDFDDDIPF